MVDAVASDHAGLDQRNIGVIRRIERGGVSIARDGRGGGRVGALRVCNIRAPHGGPHSRDDGSVDRRRAVGAGWDEATSQRAAVVDRAAARPVRNASMTSPAAKMAHPATAMWERTTADPPGINVASASGWYANHPNDAMPIGVNSPITIVIAPAATSTPAPTQVGIALLLSPAMLRHYRRRNLPPFGTGSSMQRIHGVGEICRIRLAWDSYPAQGLRDRRQRLNCLEESLVRRPVDRERP